MAKKTGQKADHYISNGGTDIFDGLANKLAVFFTAELAAKATENEIGSDPDQKYEGPKRAHSCHNQDHVGQVFLCASTNTLGRYVDTIVNYIFSKRIFLSP